MKTLRMAARGLARNPKRSGVTMAAMAFAAFGVILYHSLLDGLAVTLERSAIGKELGDLQIHAPGWLRDPDLYRRIPEHEKVVAGLEAAGIHATSRLYAFALVATGDSSSGAELRGIDPARESTVTELAKQLKRGKWLSAEDPRGVVLGSKLARTLAADVGSELVVLTQATDGSTADETYRVIGVMGSVGERADRAGVFLPIATLRDLLVLPEGAHEIAAARGARPLAEAVAAARGVAPDQEVKSWSELRPALAQMIQTTEGSRMMLMLVTYLAIALVVLNATLMSVFERIQEVGVLKAIGVTPLEVTGLILSEVAIEVLLSSAAAMLFALPLVHYLSVHGIDLSAITGTTTVGGVSFDPIWRAELSPRSFVTPVVTLAVIGLGSALYPGVKAARLSPVEAIYHR